MLAPSLPYLIFGGMKNWFYLFTRDDRTTEAVILGEDGSLCEALESVCPAAAKMLG